MKYKTETVFLKREISRFLLAVAWTAIAEKDSEVTAKENSVLLGNGTRTVAKSLSVA